MDFKKLPRMCTIQQINRKIKNYTKVYSYWLNIWNKYKKTLNSTKLLRGLARKKIRYLNICHNKVLKLIEYNCKFYRIPRLVKKVQEMQKILFIFRLKVYSIRLTLKQVVNGSQ